MLGLFGAPPWLGATIAALLGLVFVAAGIAKLLPAASGAGNLVTGIATLAPPRGHRLISASLGTVETTVGLGLLLSPAMPVRWAAVGLLAVALGATLYLKRAWPEAGCGCFGSLSTAPVRGLTIARTVLVLLVALAGVVVTPAAGLAVTSGSALELAIFVAGLIALVAVSPESWEHLPPRDADRAELELDCAVRRVPHEHTLRALHASREWRAYAGVLRSARAVDVWREGCWRLYVYDGRQADRAVQVVFAIQLEGRPPQVKVAVVDARTDAVLTHAQ